MDDPNNRAHASCRRDCRTQKAECVSNGKTISESEYTIPLGKKDNAACCPTREIASTRSSPWVA